ncbi:MAG TPA: site-specific integrase [Candidatus Paenibacillus intestinavium]|nr:site-specific integrase [Candidatus Paenibacillus intestinavium]
MATFRKRGTKWEYRIRYTDRQSGKRKEKAKGGFTTKKEAQVSAIEEESKINQFGFAENGDEFVEKYFEEWLEVFKRPNVKPITYSVQERNVRLNILPRWGNYRLKDITRVEYQKWINSLIEKYSEGTIRRIQSIFSSAMHDAVHEFRIIRDNPIQRISIPRDVKTKEISFFNKDELVVFLESLTITQKNAKYQLSKQYFYLFTLMARTGLRIGEALALNWSDLHEDKLIVNKTLVYPTNTTAYISTPKTKKSKREIKLDEYTVKILKQHSLNQKQVILRYANYQSSKNGYMFHQHDGRWLRTNVVRDYFKVACERASVPILSPHALRHTHAVHLLEAGANIKYVSERLGHASIVVTADTYLHITDKIEDDNLSLYSAYI